MIKTFILLITLIAMATPVEAEVSYGMQGFLATPEGFYTLFGSMVYATQTCNLQMPERLIDKLAKAAGVTKKMVMEEGGPIIREAIAGAKAAAENVGIDVWCVEQRGEFEQLHKNGW